MFTIDFTKPWLYKDIIYFNQGNLSTNNTLRCKLVTGGSDDFTGGSIACRFETKESPEINGLGKLIDAKNGIIDIVFPSNALIVGTNRLEILVNRADGGVAQSPPVMYDIWQGLTTGNGVEAETNYPILVELINSTNEASNKANLALNKANSMITDITDAIDNAYRSANEADIATSNANSKIEEVETSKLEMIKKVDTSIANMNSSVEDAKTDMQATTDAKIQQVDNSISNMKVETNTAIDNMVSETDEKITDVNRAIAAGTKDLEVKEARKDANGVVHDTLEQRLKSDLIVGDKSLKDFVVDMNGMKESQDFAYELPNGQNYLVCKDTQNGVVKDLKVYGKSLVNLFDTTDFDNNENRIRFKNFKNKNMFSDGIYSFENKTNKKIVVEVFKISDNSWVKNIIVEPYIIKNITLKVDEYIATFIGLITDGWNITEKDYLKKSCVIIKGAHNIIPDYFEGIASVGNGNEIEVLSVNSNILNKDKLLSISTTVFPTIKNNGFEVDYSSVISIPYYEVISTKEMFLSLNVVKKGSGDIIVRGYKNVEDLKASSNFTFSKGISLTGNITGIQIPIGTNFVAFHRGNSSTGLVEIDNIMVTFDSSPLKYISHLEDKKPILFKDSDGTWKPVTELRGVDENNCDTIDSSMLTRNIDRIVLDGSQNITQTDNTQFSADILRFEILVNDATTVKNNYDIPLICDKMPSNNLDNNRNIIRKTEFVSLHPSIRGVMIFINKSKLETPDIPGMKKYLQNNNWTILYKTSSSKQYEVNPLDLQSFENETMILIDGGIVSPNAEFKMTSSLPSFAKNIEDRVSRLEKDIYKVNLANFTVALNMVDLKVKNSASTL